MRYSSIFVALLVTAAWGQEYPDTDHLYVSSEGVVEVAPNMAEFDIGITVVKEKLREAKEENDVKTATLIRLARELGLAEGDLTSGPLAIHPHYRDCDCGREQDGYTVSRRLTLRLRDLDNYYRLTEVLVEAGITDLRHATVTHTDREALEREALRRAIDNAKAKAEMIAEQFGVKLGDVFRISEERIEARTWPRPGYWLGFGGTEQVVTRADVYVPGTISVKRRIYAVYQLVSATGE